MRSFVLCGSAFLLLACAQSETIGEDGGGAPGAGTGGESASGTGGSSASGGAATGGATSGGSSTGGAASGGAATGGATGGSSTGGAATGGAATGGAGTGGTATGGAATGGMSTGGMSTGGAATGGSSTGGESTGGAGTGGDGTGGGSGSETFALDRVIIGSTSTTGSVVVGWDTTNLVLDFQILDAALHSDSGNDWEDDGVELYVDLDNGKSSSFQAGDFQINVKRGSSTANGTGGATWAAIVVEPGTISGGYAITVTIPWTALGTTGGAMLGDTIGFDIAVNDDANGGTRDAQLMWTGGVYNYENPSLWGELVLD